MATKSIAYYLRPNPTETAEKAPYLPILVPNGVANLNDLLADIKDGIATTDARAKIALEAAISLALEHVRKGETVDFGGFRLKPRIPGSVPCEDTPFDIETNALVVDVLADEELRDTFDAIVPYKVDAEEMASTIKVSNVMDVESQEVGVIVGSKEFLIVGNGITLDGEGEGVKLLDKKTGEVVAEATVDSVSKGQRATCHFEEYPDLGAHTLEIATKGLVGGNLRVFHKAVEVKDDPSVAVTGWKYSDDGDNWIVKDSGECQEIYGRHLPTADYGATKPNRVTVTFTKPGEADPTTIVCDVATFASTPNRVKVQPNAALVAALGSMDVGESLSATMNLIVDDVEIALTDLHLEKG